MNSQWLNWLNWLNDVGNKPIPNKTQMILDTATPP